MNPEVIHLIIEEIRRDKVHGASQLAREAAQLLKAAAESSQAVTAAQFLLEQRKIGQALMSARPAMASIFNIVSSLLGKISEKSSGLDLEAARKLAISEADAAIDASLQAIVQIARRGAELIKADDVIMTHSYSSTVMAMLSAARETKDFSAIVTRSGPGRSGENIARELAGYGIRVTFIDDAAVGLYTPRTNKIIVGADRICADGKLVNGIGTYQLALAAERAGIPFYVLCETLKFDSRIRGDEVDLEGKEPSEVVMPGTLPPDVEVKNPYFDITPPELIAGIVTEDGLLTPQQVIDFMGRQSALN